MITSQDGSWGLGLTQEDEVRWGLEGSSQDVVCKAAQWPVLMALLSRPSLPSLLWLLTSLARADGFLLSLSVETVIRPQSTSLGPVPLSEMAL